MYCYYAILDPAKGQMIFLRFQICKILESTMGTLYSYPECINKYVWDTEHNEEVLGIRICIFKYLNLASLPSRLFSQACREVLFIKQFHHRPETCTKQLLLMKKLDHHPLLSIRK